MELMTFKYSGQVPEQCFSIPFTCYSLLDSFGVFLFLLDAGFVARMVGALYKMTLQKLQVNDRFLGTSLGPPDANRY